jgi:hypothetical protein
VFFPNNGNKAAVQIQAAYTTLPMAYARSMRRIQEDDLNRIRKIPQLYKYGGGTL